MLFRCDRRIPVRRASDVGVGPSLTFTIEADSGAEASRVADELTYAEAWKRGVFPDKGHKRQPDKWAMDHARGVNTIPGVSLELAA